MTFIVDIYLFLKGLRNHVLCHPNNNLFLTASSGQWTLGHFFTLTNPIPASTQQIEVRMALIKVNFVVHHVLVHLPIGTTERLIPNESLKRPSEAEQADNVLARAKILS